MSKQQPNVRVAQWATGTIGLRALRAVIEHPQLTLAGVHVNSAAKVGRDAGELCGLGPAGVTTTDDIGAIIAARPNCVLYMPPALNVDEVCTLLAAGINVVTTAGAFHHPPSMDPAIRERVEHACAAGHTSVHSTGSSPGFITEALPLVISSLQRRLTTLAIDEYADLSRRDSPQLLFDVMGFGKPMGPFDQFRADYLKASFGPSLRLVADAVGLPLDEVTAAGEFAAAHTDVVIAAGTLAAGSVAAQRITITGVRAGRLLLQFRANWYCTTELDADWPLGATGWHISAAGDAPLEIDLRMPVPLERMAEVSPAYTANRAVNAVPYVCAAQPGIRSTLDLPQILARL
ncbi:NAD(P)H-dependent amine dehydrogenase family protein [Mycobacterium sp. BMJ-28]